MNVGIDPVSPPPQRRLIVLAPLAVFLSLAALFLIRLGTDPSQLPSALIGRSVPTTALPPIPGLERDGKPVPGIAPQDFRDAVTVLNVWGSWCIPCRAEAPVLMRLSEDRRIRVVGIDYKDDPANALRFLRRYGNPFVASGADESGRAGIEWGVYGVPETFVVGRDGTILYKLVGELTPENLERIIKPVIERALGGGS